MINKERYDIAIIGAGAAGCMAAIKAAELKKKVLLLERNSFLGKKILLTGNGRCNLTNTAAIDIYIKKFIRSGKFLRTAFSRLTNENLIDFFHRKELKFKIEDGGKVFPTTDKARSIVSILEKYLKENNIEIAYSTQILSVKHESTYFLITTQDHAYIEAKKIIMATGGSSYPTTGSDGSGVILAKSLGHATIPFTPALVPLTTAEIWVKDLQGLSFQSVRVTIDHEGKRNVSDPGDILFTHFGLSGPLIIDLSASILCKLKEKDKIKITIDLKPEMSDQELHQKLARSSIAQGSTQIKNLINTFLPKRMTPIFLSLLSIKPEKMLNQITKKERLAITAMLKAFPLTVIGSLSMDHAMVTNGGIPVDEIDQRTLGSKLVEGLYFAGEMIDGRGPSGGYNLQQAFSTGFLAGESAAKDLENI
ncbi:MAG: NAD(P)/FAD-dependent oxidoreductase [Candidatus Omnitrophota bacterium]